MCEQNDTTTSHAHASIERVPSFVRRTKASRAAVLRTVSGQTAGVSVQSRRGSFLILVVGVLALLSVIAVLYATLGSGDRERAGAVVQKQRLDDYPDGVRDYIGDVIARDGVDTVLEIAPGASNPPTLPFYTFSRESWDYPFTSWQTINQYNNAASVRPLFTPWGGPRFQADGTVAGNPPRQWVAGDPFLASPEPEFLGYDGSSPSTTDVSHYYLDRKDWAHISNVGPDGRYVNLALLRGNFDIPSRGLTAALSVPGPTGAGIVSTVPGLSALDPHHPAHFDSRQIGAFRPMFDNLTPGDFNSIRNQWADADGDGFADSRWFEMVDATGSATDPMGLAELSIIPHDSSIRYFVAARIIDLGGLINVNTATDLMSGPTRDRPIGSSPGEVDLRALLMQQHQYDLQHTTPQGAPANTEGYAALHFDQDRGAVGVQDYGDATRPSATLYDVNSAWSMGHFGYQAVKLSLAASTPVPPKDALSVGGTGSPTWAGLSLGTPDPTNPNNRITFAGQYNIVDDASRQAWDFDSSFPGATGVLSPAEARFQAYRTQEFGSRGLYGTSVPDPATGARRDVIGHRGLFDENDLFELLKYHGANDPSVTSNLEMVMGGRGENLAVGNYYDLYSPLRDNRTLGNERPERLQAAATDPRQWEQFQLASMVDIRQRLTTISAAREIRLAAGVSPDRLSDDESRLNPLSALTRIGQDIELWGQHPSDHAFNALFNTYLDALAPYVAEGNSTDQNYSWNRSTNVTRADASRFLSYGYQGAEFSYITAAVLAANMGDKFDRDSMPQARTLLIDNDARVDLATDSTQTIDLQKFPWWHSFGGDADALHGDKSATRRSTDILAGTSGSPADLRLASSGRNDQVNAKAINIFGVEPQAFLTGATMFTVYSDAPQSAGGGAQDESNDAEVDIRGFVGARNSDFVMRVVAFQLTNPFNVDVQLGASELNSPSNPATDDTDQGKAPGLGLWKLDVGDPAFPPITNFKDYSYIEFGGRQYALIRLQEQVHLSATDLRDPRDPAKIDDALRGQYPALSSASQGMDTIAQPITVPAGESVVVYALSQVPRQILTDKMTRLDTTYMGQPLPIARNASPREFHRIISKHIADRGLGIGRPTANTVDPTHPNNGIADQDGVYWIPEFKSPLAPTAGDPDIGKMGMSAANGLGARFTSFADSLSANSNAGFSDLLSPSSTNANPDNQVIKLWRCMRAGNEPITGPTPMPGTFEHKRVTVTPPDKCWDENTAFTPRTVSMFDTNDRHDDLLVDRLRLPASADFNVHTMLPNHANLSDQNQINGTRVNPTSGPDVGTVGDDTGYTITMWEAVNRPTDPLGGTDQIKSGSLPAYCLERKLRVDPSSTTPVSWNVRNSNIRRFPLRRSDFQDGGVGGTPIAGAADRFRFWFDNPNRLGPSNPDVVIEPVARAPWDRNPTNADRTDTPGRFNAGNPGSTTGVEKPILTNDRPELIVNNNRYCPPGTTDALLPALCSLRTVDMLSPLAVGTIQDPDAALPGNWAGVGLTPDDVVWTTLSESMCLALGYEVAPMPDRPCAVRAMYPTHLNPTSNLFVPLYDHAQLKLNDYVPFYDENNDGEITYANDAEYRRGAQTPLAWNVLDVFSTRASTLDTTVPGEININTASPSVMACVPMLAPSTITNDPYRNTSGQPDWWWPTPTGQTTGEGTASDIAATVVAARDKSTVYFRPMSAPAAMTGGFVSFDEPSISGLDYSTLQARYQQTNIFGIGELPGFRTPGSFLMAKATLFGYPASLNAIVGGESLPCNIDFLGHDTGAGPNPQPKDSSFLGVTPGTTRNWNTTTSQWDENQPNLAGNDYQEKLAIAGAALGSTTNRSDIFAAWFIVQGYRKDDVTGLTNDQPMVPSVKRRFVMVVDRSNVRQVGDKPKILLFKEVPAD